MSETMPSFAELCLPHREVQAIPQIRTKRTLQENTPPHVFFKGLGSLIEQIARKKAHHMNQMMWGTPQQSMYRGCLASAQVSH